MQKGHPGAPTDRGRSSTDTQVGCSGQQNAATQRNMRREEQVTVQGPVKEQQPDGMSHRGGWSDRKAPMVPLMRILFC